MGTSEPGAAGTGSPIRVLLVDDRGPVRASVERLLREVPEIQVVGSAGGGMEALFLVPRVRPDVVLMDLSMPEMDGIQATRAILLDFPAVRVLAFTAYTEPGRVTAALAAGATGYLVKGGDLDEMVEAIQATAAGKRWLSPVAAAALRAHGP